jgi:hypothetical protein
MAPDQHRQAKGLLEAAMLVVALSSGTIAAGSKDSREGCHAHGNNLYGYGGQALKIWHFKITKVYIFKSI